MICSSRVTDFTVNEAVNTSSSHLAMQREVVNILKICENDATYCFNEPLNHRGIFNGILTCQSESYSLLIDTYIKDNDEKTKYYLSKKGRS